MLLLELDFEKLKLLEELLDNELLLELDENKLKELELEELDLNTISKYKLSSNECFISKGL